MMSEAKERVLQTAEALFHRHGYQAVTMRDLARELGMRQASLYYHVPQGKEQLFVEVTQRSLARHRSALEEAIVAAGPDLQAQLHAAAAWITAQTNFRLMQMVEGDMAALSAENEALLQREAYRALFVPLVQAFTSAAQRGEIRPLDADHLAGLFLTTMEGVMYVARAGHADMPAQAIAEQIIDVLLNGLRPRGEEG